MTLQTMVETVRGPYPDAPVTQVIGQINSSIQGFVEETFILDKSKDLSLNALVTDLGEDIVTDEGDTILAGEGATHTFDLPSDLLRLYNLEFLTTTGVAIKNAYEYRVEHNRITFYDFYDRTRQLITDGGGVVIRLHYYYIPATLVALTSVPDVPEKFHIGILSNVFKTQALLHRESQAAALWEKDYRDAVRMGKRFANDRQTTADVSTRPDYF